MDNLNHEEYSKMILALQQEKEKLKIVAEMTANLVFEYHIDENTMLYTNYNAKWNLEPCVTNYTDFLLNSDIIFEKDRNRAKEFCRQLQIGQKEIHAILRRKFNNDYRWVEVAAKTIFDEMQQPSVVIGKITDIDERKKKEILLEKMSKIDSLTNLYNQATIRQEIIQALRNRNARDLSALFIIDIDYFKQINAQYGHLFGDAVLGSVAENLLNIFGKKALVGRIGGDEFIAYLPNTSRMEVESLANDFGKKLCDDFKDRLKEFKLKVTASIGVAFSIGKDKFYEDFFIEADKALYYVKNIGKHGYEIYDGSDKYVSKEQLINQLDLNTSIIPQEGDSE